MGYDVYREESIYQLLPAADSHSSLDPPLLTAILTGDSWMVDGTEDASIVEQIIKIIELDRIAALDRLSAAS